MEKPSFSVAKCSTMFTSQPLTVALCCLLLSRYCTVSYLSIFVADNSCMLLEMMQRAKLEQHVGSML